MFYCHDLLLRKSVSKSHTLEGFSSRGTLREQRSSVCTNDLMGILQRENFHLAAKCSTKFNRLNYLGANSPGKLSELENAPSCVSLEHAPGAKPLVCIGLRPGAAYSANRCIMFTLIC